VAVDAQGCPVPVTPQEQELLDTGTIRLDRVYFEEGRAELKPESSSALDAVGEILTRWPQLEIEIGGHTDSEGDDEFNLVLSRSRAQAVYDYLASHFPGLRLGQFVVRGYGETQPVTLNDTPESRARNRRVEFRVLNRGVLRR
jgi:outer membrane protein OmpA-like peptidoglycan-associated protein